MIVKIQFDRSEWLIGVYWFDRDMREMMDEWRIYVCLGPMVLWVGSSCDG